MYYVLRVGKALHITKKAKQRNRLKDLTIP